MKCNLSEGRILHGEDVSFGVRLHQAGLKLWCDTRLKVGHIRHKIIY
jgi:GT2 family glycosyltransferase